MTTNTSFTGKAAAVEIITEPSGARFLSVTPTGGTTQKFPTMEIDMQAMQVSNLQDAAQKAADTGEVKTFDVKNVSGPKGKIIAFFRKTQPTEGYGTFIRKGKKSLRFDFKRLDLEALKAKNFLEAFTKIVHGIGKIPLKEKIGA
jgi:hypothetical protein